MQPAPSIFNNPFINPFDRNVLFRKQAEKAFPPLVSPTDYTESPDTPSTFLKWALKRKAVNTALMRPDLDCDYNNPATFHHDIQSAGARTHPGDSTSDDWRVELARFHCPEGTTGIIRAIEQYLSTEALQAKTTWSENGYWGRPVEAPGTWHFRIEQISQTAPPWINELNPALPLPGFPYAEWTPIPGLWYPSGSAASQNHHLVVPAGYVVRLIWEYDHGDIGIPTVAAVLRGSRHNQFAPETKAVLRSLW